MTRWNGVGPGALQVADVLAEKNLLADAQRHVFLRCAPTPRMVGSGLWQLHGQRRIAARAAQELRRAVDDPEHAVIGVARDGAVVDEEAVGDGAQALERLPFIGADRFIREIAAGRDDGKAKVGKQQVMQRRVGQHDAHVGIARRHGVGKRRSGAARQQHDGRGGGCQQSAAAGGTSQSVFACARSRTMTASGLAGRALRARSRCTASSLRASTSR